MGVLLISTVMIGIVAELYWQVFIEYKSDKMEFYTILSYDKMLKTFKIGSSKSNCRAIIHCFQKNFCSKFTDFQNDQGQGKLNMKQYFANFYSNNKSTVNPRLEVRY